MTDHLWVTEAIVALAGFGIGILGTLIGAGGGFLIVPLLALLEPSWTTDQITAFSLAVVTANAVTGACSYSWHGRVDRFTFLLYSLAVIPGAIFGAFATGYIPRPIFDPFFGAVLILIGVWLFLKPGSSESGRRTGNFERVLIDRRGRRFEWSFDPRIGFASSILVGFLSSLLGIGGGIIHVPLLATVLGFPAHIATATSQAILAVTACAGTIVHIVHGDYRTTWPLVLAGAASAVLGAPVGARLAGHVPGAAILRILAIALAFVGLRLLVSR